MEEVLIQGQDWQGLKVVNEGVLFLNKPVSTAFHCETSPVLERT